MVIPPQDTDKSGAARHVYSVSLLNRAVKQLLESAFASIWVEGEISNLARPASGHLYFSLKDSQAQVRCALFRGSQRSITATPTDGMHVLVRARASLYEGRGDYQLIIEHLEDAGEGALRRAYEALKRQLAQEGLFDPAHKQPLPTLPRRIGIISSLSGAVLHDVLTTLRRRFPAIAVRVYPVPVQGEGAADKIAAAIRLAGTRRDCDALILARGGGSLEDLQAFNDEAVARAIHACPVPLVCGVGHETDFTIADFVADARAPTPTAAAEMLSPHHQDWLAELERKRTRLARLMRDRLYGTQQRLDWLAARVIHPHERILRLRARLHELALRLRLAQTATRRSAATALLATRARLEKQSPARRVHELHLRFRHTEGRLTAEVRHALERHRERLRQLARGLEALSPLATLARGYAIVRLAGSDIALRDARGIDVGARVQARLAHGQLSCIVEDIDTDA